MICILLIFQAVLVIGIVLFTLGFLISSLKENESRAAMMAGAICGLLVVIEICIYSLYALGFFSHFAGKLVLVSAWMAAGAVVYFLRCRTDPNQRALKAMSSAKFSDLMSGNRFLPGSVPCDPVPLNIKSFIAPILNWNKWIRKEEKQAACWGSPAPLIGPVSYPMFRP